MCGEPIGTVCIRGQARGEVAKDPSTRTGDRGTDHEGTDHTGKCVKVYRTQGWTKPSRAGGEVKTVPTVSSAHIFSVCCHGSQPWDSCPPPESTERERWEIGFHC